MRWSATPHTRYPHRTARPWCSALRLEERDGARDGRRKCDPPEAGKAIVEHYLMMKNTRATARITRSTIGLRKTAYSTPTIPSAKPYSMILEKASMAE